MKGAEALKNHADRAEDPNGPGTNFVAVKVSEQRTEKPSRSIPSKYSKRFQNLLPYPKGAVPYRSL